jgi:hypothetical protein
MVDARPDATTVGYRVTNGNLVSPPQNRVRDLTETVTLEALAPELRSPVAS